MNTKKMLHISVCIISALIVVLVAASRTSPVYSLLIGDIGGNNASAAMVIGKYWLEGVIPYKDLFSVGGPVYFLIQAIGWFIGGRNGLFFLEIIGISLFLIYNRKIATLFVSEIAATIISLFTLLPYMAMCNGGNSAAEWSMVFTTVGMYHALAGIQNEQYTRTNWIVIGLTCGIIVFTNLQSLGVIGAAVLYGSRIAVHRKDKNAWWMLISLLVPILVVGIYFAVVDAFIPMLQGAIVFPLKAMCSGFDRTEVIVHKVIKCMLAMPLLAAGIICVINKKKALGVCACFMAAGTILLLMLGDNEWHYYLAAVPTIPAAIAILFVNEKKYIRIFSIVCAMVVSILVLIPLKNELRILYNGVPEVIDGFYTDLKEYDSQFEECRIHMEDMDSSYYLLLDSKPMNQYFTDQTQLAGYDNRIMQQISEDQNQEYDVVITHEHGWQGRHFEKYVVTQVYIKTGGSICVYVPY